MAANAQYAATPRVGSALLTTADTSLTAPSTVGTVLAAGASGTRIDYIDIQGVATTAAGIIEQAGAVGLGVTAEIFLPISQCLLHQVQAAAGADFLVETY
jgi:hypothetical protein